MYMAFFLFVCFDRYVHFDELPEPILLEMHPYSRTKMTRLCVMALRKYTEEKFKNKFIVGCLNLTPPLSPASGFLLIRTKTKPNKKKPQTNVLYKIVFKLGTCHRTSLRALKGRTQKKPNQDDEFSIPTV